MNLLKSFVVASRPKTLIAALCPVLIGAAFSYYYLGRFETFAFVVILATAVCIQVATNFFNDALDHEKGRDSQNRLGPRRAAAGQLLSPRLLKRAALVLLFVSLILSLFLFFRAGWIVFVMGLPALFLAYLYTGTRFSLSATGTADLFVILYFGLIPVWGTQVILSGHYNVYALFPGLLCGLFCNALLLVNNLRDEEEDRSHGKKTLVVRLGRRGGLVALFFCLLFPYVLNFWGLFNTFFRASLWIYLVLPLAVFIFFKVAREKPSQKYNFYLALVALHLLLFTLFYSNGVLSS